MENPEGRLLRSPHAGNGDAHLRDLRAQPLAGRARDPYSPDGGGYVDVCELCSEIALEYGWLREGTQPLPAVQLQARRRRGRFGGLLRAPRAEEAPVADEPILRRLSEPELALVEAADLFNLSQHRRTVAGVAKSLGAPQASIIPLSGVTGEMIVTVAWEISWYQYRVSPDSPQPVRLVERGHDIGARGLLPELERSARRRRAPDARHRPDLGFACPTPRRSRSSRSRRSR